MKTRRFHCLRGLCLLSGCFTWMDWAHAQQNIQFTGVQLLSNNEIELTLTAPANFNYRIDAATELPKWSALATLSARSETSQPFTDSLTHYPHGRFYRAVQLAGSDAFTGDHLPTAEGDVVIHPLFHASFVMSWNGKTIYNDPDDDSNYRSTYEGLPKADLILVSHSHGDHFSASQIEDVRSENGVIIVPQAVYNNLSAPLKAAAIVLANGASTNFMGLTLEAVPAYNANHPRGSGNGYVLTIGGKRLYMSGDTGNIPETRALANVDVAFLCMNQPFTMTVNDATNCVTAFRPKVVYPYHYRNQDGSLNNANTFKQRLAPNLGVEVRLRKWY